MKVVTEIGNPLYFSQKEFWQSPVRNGREDKQRENLNFIEDQQSRNGRDYKNPKSYPANHQQVYTTYKPANMPEVKLFSEEWKGYSINRLI